MVFVASVDSVTKVGLSDAFQAGVICESENGASLPHSHTQQLSSNFFYETNGSDGDIEILGDKPTGSLHLGKLVD